MNPIQARDRSHLQQLVREHIRIYGDECDLNHIDLSDVTNMSCLFQQSNFNGNISSWDLSSLTPYAGMRAFHEFHDSPLGYLGVLKGEYDLLANVRWAAHFYHLRSLCDGLSMDELSAAQFIYQRIALGFSQGMALCHDTLPTNMDFSCKEG